ncbi:MAG TPA: glycerol kinase GlpK [Thermotogota bacterium]|nr:glycerol kinase GlpK [Thermotogota bacterium]HPJ87614.1 glycerol kinase GlpK [Thermotogota bacterium]HPR94819.1 glycerol kinase GlpK [Thermotogota bacterium]
MRDKSFIAAIDQGTTSTRTIIFDEKLNIVNISQKPFQQFYPQDGWVEQDAEEIYRTAIETLVDAIDKSGLNFFQISAIGITNQRETVVAWNKETGEPLYRAINWQCRRTTERCEELKRYEEMIHAKTGLIVDPYFSGSKMEWLYNHVPKIRIAAESDQLAFGTIDSWLAYKLSRKNVHVTDVSNASRTMLFNINNLDWDDELLDLFSIDRKWLPKIVDTSTVIGYTREGIPIASLVGDQQGALFGQMAHEKGMAKCTYGTGAFLLMNMGSNPVLSNERLLTTVGWKIEDEVCYAMEGSLFMCGAAIDWIVDNLKLAENASQTEDLAYSVRDNGGVYFIPALAGLGAPHWDPNARGLFMGMTQSVRREHLVRSVLEGICYNVRELFDIMMEESSIPLTDLRVDGGVSKNEFLQEFQSVLLGIPVTRPVNTETTATGAAILAGLAIGVWKDKGELTEFWEIKNRLTKAKEEKVEENYKKWKKAVERSKNWN